MKHLHKIRIFTYSNGFFDEEFYAENDTEADMTANEIFFSYDDGWWYEFIFD